jgi:tetratricopeptide (TPR) repeat protein
MRAGAIPTRAPAPRLSHLVGWAREAHAAAEGDAPRRRSGTLYARNPQWQEQDFPLPMKSMTVDVVVENQVARVALDQTFHNPRPETLEGVYRFTVPPDAALQRLAMYVDGTLTESAVVERMQARRIYEEIVYRRRDPALAEWTGAGRVDMRIFPLFGNQDKRVILAYTQSLPRLYDDWTLTVPMPELDDAVDEVAMKVRIADCGTCEVHSPSHDVDVARDGDAAVVTYQKAGERVGDSLVLTVRDAGKEARVARAGDGDVQYLLVRGRPDIAGGLVDRPDPAPRRWVILDDVSASRSALERRAQAELIDRLVDTIDEDDLVTVATFDVGVRRHGEEMTRAASLDRRALRTWLLEHRGGVGATDLGAALDEASAILGENGAIAAEDAYVVYLGDGVVTGGARDLAALEQRLEGKATFIGFAVGDGADVPSLGALADATGGLVVPIDPADDLGWRALDAVAVLYTPRVTGLEARVVDPAGKPVSEAFAYLRGGQLAEGDELEVVVRAPKGAEIAAVEVRGERAGAAWQHRIELASATAHERAGYLPRLWAQKHVQALILKRATAPAPQPCAGEPCPTIEEQRIAYREALRKEIVALGKQFFLLSPHTSLIVLENDAMYAQYGVEKGKNLGWAAYRTPDKIPVVTGGTPSSIADVEGLALVRTPVQPFYSYNYYDGHLDGRWQQNEWQLARRGAVLGATTETGGLAWGTIGGGGGTGGLLRGDAGFADSTLALESVPVSASITAIPAEPAAGEDKSGGLVANQAAARDEDGELSLDFVTTDGLRESNNSWSVGETRGTAKGGKRSRRWGGGLSDRKNNGFTWGGQPYAIAWNYASDYRLDDLTEFVPAFFPGELDAAMAELRAASGGVKGSIDDGARALLVAARRRLEPGVYRWGAGPEITVDSGGGMAWRLVHDTGLEEVVTFEDGTLRRRYDELGLEVVRELGDATPALLMTVLPLLTPDPDQLARWYVVTKKADRTIALAPASAPTAPTLELELDADGRLLALRTASGRDLIAVRWDRGEPVGATVLGEDVTVARAATTIASAAKAASTAPAGTITVALPLRPPAYWRNQLESLAAGTDEWRAATRNLMAALAATQDPNGAVAALRELDKAGEVAAGDLVLASGALVRSTTDAELIDLLEEAGDAGRLVGRYLSASRAYGKKPRAGVFSPVAGVDGAALIATLAKHREVLAQVENGKLEGALTTLRLSTQSGKPSVLHVIAAMQIAAHAYNQPKAAEAWDTVAAGPWKNVARYEAARAYYNRGDYAGAATRMIELLGAVDPDAMPITVDWTAKSAVTYSARGQVGWQLAWTAYRNAILDRGDFADVMALLAGAMQVGEADVDRILGRAADLAAGDPDAIAEIVGRALALGQVDRAAPLLDGALAKERTPELLRLAAQVAERQGRVADAADHLDEAMKAEEGEPISLGLLRADMQHLLALRGRVALLATGADRERALDAAVALSDRWRDVDPDNAAIDRQIGELLLAGGRRDEAWRQLSTAIERHPMEGDGWALVAEVMEKEGRLDESLSYWQQAVVIDQTNPTWRMRKAQTLFALGRDDEGKALLEEIQDGAWHERWLNVTYQVQTMLRQLETQQRNR